MAKRVKKTTKQATVTKPVIDALAEISEAITSDLYLEDILKLIVKVTAQVLGSKICSLMLLNKEGELEVKATQSVSEEYNKKPNIKSGQGIAGMVIQTGKPMSVLDVRQNPRYINTEIARKENLCSLLCVPLIFKGRAIGVLNSYTSKPHTFTQNEINILRSI
ncbi:MAG: GAF domain-containing protein, partial [Candidatus Omnitrophota bacterium]